MRVQAFEKRGMSIIEDVGRIIADTHSPAEALREVAALIADRFFVDVCSIYVFDEDRNCLFLVATVGLNEESVGRIRMNLDEGLTGLVLEGMTPVFVRDPADHPRYKYFEGSGEEKYHSYLGLPLIYHGEVLGVLVIQTEENAGIDESDISIFQMIASQIAGEAAYVSFLRDLKKMSGDTGATEPERLESQTFDESRRVKKDLLKGIPVSTGFG
ncbi:MAG: GAF domain-containing protein, partial [Deltaproteobacteria bacterium]|nr:GAF domain-containing protein [Deltaproteobacteria bacterium]